MTKEELEQEAEEYVKHWIVDEDTYSLVLEAFKDGAEPREKRIAELKEIIKDLLGSENQYCEEEMFFTIRKRAEDFIK